MKSTQKIEEEKLLPSSLLEDECLEPEIIQNNESLNISALKEKNIIFEEEKTISNFLNKKNLNSLYKEEESKVANINTKFKGKSEQNLQNDYLLHFNSSNELLDFNQNFLDETKEKKWSQKNSIKNDIDNIDIPNQNENGLNRYESKVLNRVNEFHNMKFNKRITNGINGILNNFTKNFSNINNNIIDNKININNFKNGEKNKVSPLYTIDNPIINDTAFLFKNQKPLISMKNDFTNHFDNINIGCNNINIINNIFNINEQNNSFSNNNISFCKEYKFPKILSKLDKENNNISNISLNCGFPNIFNNIKNNILFSNFSQKSEEEKAEENNDKIILSLKNEETKEHIIKEFKEFCEGVKPNLVEYICSKDGIKMIKQHLKYYKSIKIKYLIKLIYTHFEKIICDKFGNYFFQRLYIISSKKHRLKILYYIKNFFVDVAKDEIGVFVIQRIIEESRTEEEKKVIMEYIKGYEMEMSLDKEGTHIIQKIIQTFDEKERQYLTDVLFSQNNVEKLLEDSNGVNVLKRMISFTKEKNNKIKLLEALNPNIYTILKSSGGDIIIYNLLEKWGLYFIIDFINILIYNFEVFASNKNSSKLIYKIIQYFSNKSIILNNPEYCDTNMNIFIILQTLKEILFKPDKVINLYGNYYAKVLIWKIRSLLTLEENQLFFSFVQSLKKDPFDCDNKVYNIYLEIFNSH